MKYSIPFNLMIVFFVSSAKRGISTQERVAIHSRVKIRPARDTNDIFCSLHTDSWPSRFPALVRENFKFVLIFRTLKMLPH